MTVPLNAKPRSYDDRGLFCTSDVQKRGGSSLTTTGVAGNCAGVRGASDIADCKAETPPPLRGTNSKSRDLQQGEIL